MKRIGWLAIFLSMMLVPLGCGKPGPAQPGAPPRSASPTDKPAPPATPPASAAPKVDSPAAGFPTAPQAGSQDKQSGPSGEDAAGARPSAEKTGSAPKGKTTVLGAMGRALMKGFASQGSESQQRPRPDPSPPPQ